MLLYDVRVNGGFPQQSLACTGTGCQGVPPAPPAFATPSSATFSGTGNFAPHPPTKSKSETRAQKLAKALKKCHSLHNRRKRARCQRLAHARYGVRKTKSARNGR
jgi:hypothetical protein